MIELRHLKKTYENAEPLKDVSATIMISSAPARRSTATVCKMTWRQKTNTA